MSCCSFDSVPKTKSGSCKSSRAWNSVKREVLFRPLQFIIMPLSLRRFGLGSGARVGRLEFVQLNCIGVTGDEIESESNDEKELFRHKSVDKSKKESETITNSTTGRYCSVAFV